MVGIVGLTPGGFFAFLATGIVVVWASVVLAQRAVGPGPQEATAP